MRALAIHDLTATQGAAPDAVERIFEPFYSTKGSKGTGIGLAVTQKIVREHDGRIEYESEVDKGTTFRLILPIEQLDM